MKAVDGHASTCPDRRRRTRSDRDDGRVSYTEHGRWVAADGYEHLVELEERFIEEFGRAEYDIAREVIERVVGLLDQLASEQEDRDAG
ncbi:hypothetical protein F1D05_01390 [Kribbella qitaiheensis]|uniref:Uncharacterized protein n=1 Tax=Kribbella qitaiheensis TaxID=1544730 RepID=A0A7G6WS31_9ACTN|nr:hypothetical protein [Kribbella qitaiheensis]QNE16796.1 hypothetical protein F1D05_01390 [Kribbella qitaiheensis]